MSRRVCGFVTCIGLAMLAGCGEPKDNSEEKLTIPSTVGRGKLPTYAQVAQGYNARTEVIERLSTQVSLIIEADKLDEQGNSTGRTRDQLEGNLSIRRPQKVALRLDKVGQNVAYLGSNDFSYWWFDLSGKEPTAIVGTHLKASPTDAADFGLPVHPLEFIELLGVMPLPTGASQVKQQPQSKIMLPMVAWSRDGKSIEVTTASRWGSRRFTMNPDTFEPSRIDLLDEQGGLAVGSLLSRYAPISVEGKPGSATQVATRIELTIPASTTQVLMVLADPRVPLQVRERAFDVMELIDAYGIKRFIDHDRIKAKRAAEAPKVTPPVTTPATTNKVNIPATAPTTKPATTPTTVPAQRPQSQTPPANVTPKPAPVNPAQPRTVPAAKDPAKPVTPTSPTTSPTKQPGTPAENTPK